MPVRRPRSRREPPPTAVQARLMSVTPSRGQQGVYDSLIRVHGRAKLLDVDEFIRRVCHMNRTWSEEQWCSPLAEQWDVRRIGHRRGLESWNRVEMLCRDV